MYKKAITSLKNWQLWFYPVVYIIDIHLHNLCRQCHLLMNWYNILFYFILHVIGFILNNRFITKNANYTKTSCVNYQPGIFINGTFWKHLLCLMFRYDDQLPVNSLKVNKKSINKNAFVCSKMEHRNKKDKPKFHQHLCLMV